MPEAFAATLARAARKRLVALERAGERAFANDDADARRLHALRIAVKRLRYTLEIVATLDPASTRDALRLLAKLQEHLGTIADADVLVPTLAALDARLPGDDARRTGLAFAEAAAAHRRAEALVHARRLWLGDPEPPFTARVRGALQALESELSPS